MADITEYGDIMPNPCIDEYGRRRIDSLLEDGTRIIVVVVPPPLVVKIAYTDGLVCIQIG